MYGLAGFSGLEGLLSGSLPRGFLGALSSLWIGPRSCCHCLLLSCASFFRSAGLDGTLDSNLPLSSLRFSPKRVKGSLVSSQNLF